MLNIGNKAYRNLPEQVAENMRQIGKLWEKLDGLDVYDNVIVLEDLDPLTPEQLEILARPVSYIVYNNEVYMKRGASASQLFFDKVYNVSETSGTVTFASGEIVVTYPLGTISLNEVSHYVYDTTKVDDLLTYKLDKTGVLDAVYPVGAIYLSTVNTSPASLFGGTWEKIKDRFLLADGDNYSAGATGGEATHTLTQSEMPSHAGHGYDMYSWLGKGNATGLYLRSANMSEYGADPRGWSINDGEVHPATRDLGGGSAHNNMPPYLVVYVWKRTA